MKRVFPLFLALLLLSSCTFPTAEASKHLVNTLNPSSEVSEPPTISPTSEPTIIPTIQPTILPTSSPSVSPYDFEDIDNWVEIQINDASFRLPYDDAMHSAGLGDVTFAKELSDEEEMQGYCEMVDRSPIAILSQNAYMRIQTNEDGGYAFVVTTGNRGIDPSNVSNDTVVELIKEMYSALEISTFVAPELDFSETACSLLAYENQKCIYSFDTGEVTGYLSVLRNANTNGFVLVVVYDKEFAWLLKSVCTVQLGDYKCPDVYTAENMFPLFLSEFGEDMLKEYAGKDF